MPQNSTRCWYFNGNGQRGEQHRPHEHVVDAERLLDQVTADELAERGAAERPGDHAGERAARTATQIGRFDRGLLRCRRVRFAVPVQVDGQHRDDDRHEGKPGPNGDIEIDELGTIGSDDCQHGRTLRLSSKIGQSKVSLPLVEAGGAAGQLAAVLTTVPEGYSPSTGRVCQHPTVRQPRYVSAKYAESWSRACCSSSRSAAASTSARHPLRERLSAHTMSTRRGVLLVQCSELLGLQPIGDPRQGRPQAAVHEGDFALDQSQADDIGRIVELLQGGEDRMTSGMPRPASCWSGRLPSRPRSRSTPGFPTRWRARLPSRR